MMITLFVSRMVMIDDADDAVSGQPWRWGRRQWFDPDHIPRPARSVSGNLRRSLPKKTLQLYGVRGLSGLARVTRRTEFHRPNAAKGWRRPMSESGHNPISARSWLGES
jgi:hypothetical protein